MVVLVIFFWLDGATEVRYLLSTYLELEPESHFSFPSALGTEPICSREINFRFHIALIIKPHTTHTRTSAFLEAFPAPL